MGKITQITSAGNNGGMMLYALCNDGRVWEFCHQTGWIELPLPVQKKTNTIRKISASQVVDLDLML